MNEDATQMINAQNEANERIIQATHGAPDHPLRIADLEIPCTY